MLWPDTPRTPLTRIDAEQERELRLIAQARAGAEWALTALVARYQPPVVRYLTRLTGDPARAGALAEQIFLRMERRLRGPHGGEQLHLWLLRAATEVGLDALRHPVRGPAPRLESSARGSLLSERAGNPSRKLREGLGKLAERTEATTRQIRQMIWANEPPPPAHRSPWQMAGDHSAPAMDISTDAPTDAPQLEDEASDPRVALRHRVVRAVLARIPYGDAQCLAMHVVAGLNQADVARALGIRPSAARRHIVQGLQLFAQRYEAALIELGIPRELAYADLPRPAADTGEGIEDSISATPDMMPDALLDAIPVESLFADDAGDAELEAATPMAGMPDEAGGAPSEPRARERAVPVWVLETPPSGPIIDTVAVASSLESSERHRVPTAEGEVSLGYEVVYEVVPEQPSGAAPTAPTAPANGTLSSSSSDQGAVVVPVLSHAAPPPPDPAGPAASAPRVVPLLSRGDSRGDALAPGASVVPVRSDAGAATAEAVPAEAASEARVVPVRTTAGRDG